MCVIIELLTHMTLPKSEPPVCAGAFIFAKRDLEAIHLTYRRFLMNDDIIKFWSLVDKSGTCWLWTGNKSSTGYGRYKGQLAHRYSMIINGTPPDNLCVCHHCDTPLCVNPSHLFLGTIQDNNADKTRKGRAAKGIKNGGVKLSTNDILKIKFAYSNSSISQRNLARAYNISQMQIWRIVNNLKWKHI
jgi:hypothetical protein